MGHKVNPDIFRLGVSKTWSYQMRTNKNFIKNLFLFRMLKNLFMNYNIPLFTFKKHRNKKVNDKLMFRGERQIYKSPFVSKNVLFSHVFFGMLNKDIYIESYFIDAGTTQQQRQYKKELYPSNPIEINSPEYKFWQPGYYKKKLLSNDLVKKKKIYYDSKSRSGYKLLFGSRNFRLLARKSKLYVVKSIKKLSRDFYFVSKNYNAKSNFELDIYMGDYLESPERKLVNRVALPRNRKAKNRNNFNVKSKSENFNVKSKSGNFKLRVLVELVSRLIFKSKYILQRRYTKNLFYFRRKMQKHSRRFDPLKRKRFRAFRRLRPVKYYNLKRNPRYASRLKKSLYDYIKINNLIGQRAVVIARTYLKKKSLPKTPLKVLNNIFFQKTRFYKVYHNIKVLKYFIRSLKFFRYFGIKKRIFFCHNLISLILNFMGLSKKTVLGKKLFIIVQNLMLYSYSLSFFNFLNLKKKYFSKYIMYKGVSKTLFRSVLEMIKCDKVSFAITAQNKYKFGSSLVLNYILIKLGQYFGIHEIVNPLSFFIKNLSCIAGYKIFIRGRLTRKERATVMIRSGKRMPLSTVSANIDYSQGFKIMKFGIVGIRVYLFMKPSTLINLYTFRYIYAKISK